MTTTAQYVSVPKSGVAQVSAANANKDGTGTLAVIFTANPAVGGGARMDGLIAQAITATTAGMLRLYLTKGRPGPVISTITFSLTVATVTTAVAHGLSTGHTVTLMGAMPDDYNVTDAAITVLSATTFTFGMSTAPTTNATTVGAFCSSLATPVTRMIREISVTAITPSATVQAFVSVMASGYAADKGYFPLSIPPGWSLRASTEKAETFNLIPTFAGDMI